MKAQSTIFFGLAAVVGLSFIGAGCSDANVAVPAKEMQEESLLTPRNYDLSGLKERDEMNNSAPSQQPAPPAEPADNPTPSGMTEGNASYQFPGLLPDERIKNKTVTIKTAKGEIKFNLLANEAPLTVSNFVYLAEQGYYDGLKFHRVVPGFVIQGGDPQGDGRGGPGYRFEDEPVKLDYLEGTVAMANAGPDTNGSQFFICLDDQPTLPKAYTIFGQVTEGMDVVKKIAIDDVMESVVVSDK